MRAHRRSRPARLAQRTRVDHQDGASFDLAGVDHWASRQFPGQGADLPKALAGRDPEKALLLLAHQPAAIEQAAAHGVDLQLWAIPMAASCGRSNISSICSSLTSKVFIATARPRRKSMSAPAPVIGLRRCASARKPRSRTSPCAVPPDPCAAIQHCFFISLT